MVQLEFVNTEQSEMDALTRKTIRNQKRKERRKRKKLEAKKHLPCNDIVYSEDFRDYLVLDTGHDGLYCDRSLYSRYNDEIYSDFNNGFYDDIPDWKPITYRDPTPKKGSGFPYKTLIFVTFVGYLYYKSKRGGRCQASKIPHFLQNINPEYYSKVVAFSEPYVDRGRDLAMVVVDYMQTRVFVGNLSPENVQNVFITTYNTAQQEAIKYFELVCAKVQTAIS